MPDLRHIERNSGMVFRKMLTDKWLREFKTVNGRFTKSKFAKGIVSPRQRYRFVV